MRPHPNRRKPFRYGILLSIIAILLTSCSPRINTSTPLPTQADVPQPVNYKILDIKTLEPELLNELDQLKQSRGYYLWQSEATPSVLLVGQGLQPTGGYAIDVENIEKIGQKLYVTVTETAPKAEDMVIQVLTYPFVMIEVPSDIQLEDIVVRNQEGKALDALVLNTEAYRVVEGNYVGQIDNNSIEVQTGDTFLVFRNALMGEFVDGLETGSLVKITYLEIVDGQRQLVDLEAVK